MVKLELENHTNDKKKFQNLCRGPQGFNWKCDSKKFNSKWLQEYYHNKQK